MDPKTRLLEAMKKNKVDRPPCICPGGMMNMIVRELVEDKELTWPDAHTNGEKMAKLARKSYDAGSFENYGVPFCMTIEAEAMGAKVSLGTMDTEPRVTEYCISKSEEYNALKTLNFSEGRPKVVLDAIKYIKRSGEEVPIIGNLVGPISLASSLVDPMVFYKEMRKKPEEVHRLLEFVTEESLKFGIEQLKAGADVITIADPSGTGEILGAKQFSAFAVPYLNRLVEGLEAYKPNSVIVHICGRLKSVYSPLNDLKAGVISFDAITSILQVKEFVKDKAIMGNVSTYTLEYGEEDKIEQISKKCVEQGVNILSPACGLGMGTPLKNIRAMKRGVFCD
jgi:[methyl-Co(III) methanol-specific corrinoid protein]:coenzyme M methyltransferase